MPQVAPVWTQSMQASQAGCSMRGIGQRSARPCRLRGAVSTERLYVAKESEALQAYEGRVN